MLKLSHYFKIGFISIFVLLIGCNGPEQKIAQLDKQLTTIEGDGPKVNEEDWKKLETSIEELTADVKANRNNYTDEQLKEIGRIYARYSKVVLKKGFIDFKTGLEDMKLILEGLGEELKSTDTSDFYEPNEP